MDADCALKEAPAGSLFPLASSGVSVEVHSLLGPVEPLKPAACSLRLGMHGLLKSF